MAKKKAKAKPGRGGKRAGAGRPVSTGSAGVKPISFRVGMDIWARADVLAKSLGLSLGELAKQVFVREIETRGPW